MLKPVKMTKVRAICLKAAAPSVAKELHKLSVLHIVDSEIPETQRTGPLPSFDAISSKLIAIRSMREALEKTGKPPAKKARIEEPLEAAEEMSARSDALATLLKEKDEVQKELDSNKASQNAIAELEGLHVNFSEIACNSLKFTLVRIPAKKAKGALEALSHKANCSFTSAPGAEGSLIALVGMQKDEDPKFIDSLGQAIPLPQISTTPRHELSSLRESGEAVRKRLEAVNGRIERFSNSNFAKIVALEEALSIEAERAQIASSFGASASLYYIEGWVEAKHFERLKKTMEGKFGRKIVVEQGQASHDEVPPTQLDNPRQAHPFQFLLEFMSLPQYTEIDPTILLAIFIPIIYAVIFGDAGFAVLSFLLAYWMVKTSKKGSLLNQVALMWAISAIPTFVMGIVYNEYFGFTHTQILSMLGFGNIVLYTGLERVTQISTLMLISIIIGMVHVGLGLILGAINEWAHSRKHAYAKLSWLGIELSGFFLIAAFVFNAFTFLGIPSVILFALSVIGLLAFEGPLSVIEIPGLASNIMSYIRIAAVGVGGVIMADAVNQLLLPKLSLSLFGVIGFILMAIVYVCVQVAVCIIGMFEGFVHGARLNVVEFFGKFYKGNGVPFAPFSSKRNYTQEV